MVNTLPSDLPYSFRYDLLAYKNIENRKKNSKKFQNFEYFPVSSELFLKWPLHPTLELKVWKFSIQIYLFEMFYVNFSRIKQTFNVTKVHL